MGGQDKKGTQQPSAVRKTKLNPFRAGAIEKEKADSEVLHRAMREKHAKSPDAAWDPLGSLMSPEEILAYCENTLGDAAGTVVSVVTDTLSSSEEAAPQAPESPARKMTSITGAHRLNPKANDFKPIASNIQREMSFDNNDYQQALTKRLAQAISLSINAKRLTAGQSEIRFGIDNAKFKHSDNQYNLHLYTLEGICELTTQGQEKPILMPVSLNFRAKYTVTPGWAYGATVNMLGDASNMLEYEAIVLETLADTEQKIADIAPDILTLQHTIRNVDIDGDIPFATMLANSFLSDVIPQLAHSQRVTLDISKHPYQLKREPVYTGSALDIARVKYGNQLLAHVAAGNYKQANTVVDKFVDVKAKINNAEHQSVDADQATAALHTIHTSLQHVKQYLSSVAEMDFANAPGAKLDTEFNAVLNVVQYMMITGDYDSQLLAKATANLTQQHIAIKDNVSDDRHGFIREVVDSMNTAFAQLEELNIADAQETLTTQADAIKAAATAEQERLAAEEAKRAAEMARIDALNQGNQKAGEKQEAKRQKKVTQTAQLDAMKQAMQGALGLSSSNPSSASASESETVHSDVEQHDIDALVAEFDELSVQHSPSPVNSDDELAQSASDPELEEGEISEDDDKQLEAAASAPAQAVDPAVSAEIQTLQAKIDVRKERLKQYGFVDTQHLPEESAIHAMITDAMKQQCAQSGDQGQRLQQQKIVLQELRDSTAQLKDYPMLVQQDGSALAKLQQEYNETLDQIDYLSNKVGNFITDYDHDLFELSSVERDDPFSPDRVEKSDSDNEIGHDPVISVSKQDALAGIDKVDPNMLSQLEIGFRPNPKKSSLDAELVQKKQALIALIQTFEGDKHTGLHAMALNPDFNNIAHQAQSRTSLFRNVLSHGLYSFFGQRLHLHSRKDSSYAGRHDDIHNFYKTIASYDGNASADEQIGAISTAMAHLQNYANELEITKLDAKSASSNEFIK